MKIKLYVDFDGVVLNTIDITYKILNDLKLNDTEEIEKFYKNLNWEELLDKCVPINDSINNLKKIIKSNLYDVSILSHVTCENEELAKKRYLDKHIPDLEVVTVDIKLNKCDVVDCKNAILVDDYMGNLNLWHAKGGIAVKFSDKGKNYEYITISSLDMLIDKYREIGDLISLKQ